MREPESYLDTLERRESCRVLLNNSSLSAEELADVRACIDVYTARLVELRSLDAESDKHRSRTEAEIAERAEREHAEAEARALIEAEEGNGEQPSNQAGELDGAQQ